MKVIENAKRPRESHRLRFEVSIKMDVKVKEYECGLDQVTQNRIQRQAIMNTGINLRVRWGGGGRISWKVKWHLPLNKDSATWSKLARSMNIVPVYSF
jgi:hypothetical protein